MTPQQTDKKENQTAQETGKAKYRGQYQEQDTHKFDCVTQFIVGLRIIGDGDEGHIEHDLGIEPAGVDGKFPDHQAGDDGQRRTEHVRRMDGGQFQSVYGQFQQ